MDYCKETAGQAQLRMLGEPRTPSTLMSQLPLALFDEIECGMIVCDSRRLIHFANQAARHELAVARLLQRSQDCLRRAPGATGELEAALRMAVQRGRRSLVRLAASGDHLLASVLPLCVAGDEGPYALLMLGRRQPCSELGLEMLAGCYGLTLAERRVLAALMREATPREIATENDVALSTVRTQISSIRTKLGARRIEGLLLRAAEVPPLANALRINFGGQDPLGAAMAPALVAA